MPDRSMTRLYRPLTESLANRLQCAHRETGRKRREVPPGRRAGSAARGAQAKEAARAKRGAGLWRPEAAPCPREGHARDRGLSPLRIPQEASGCRPSRALHLRGARTCTRSPRFWPRNRVLARDGTTARDTENAEQAFCRRKRRTDNAKEGFSCQNSVSWPKTTDSRARRRGACCALAVQNSESRHHPPAPPFRKRRQIPISVSARRAQPRQSREGPPPRSARRRRARPSRRSARTPGSGRRRADRSPHGRRNRAAA